MCHAARLSVIEAFSIRLAREDDIPALDVLIPLSVRVLQASFYSAAQIEAALGPVFGVDRQLIRDGTYCVAEHSNHLVGCGGWSRRHARRARYPIINLLSTDSSHSHS